MITYIHTPVFNATSNVASVQMPEQDKDSGLRFFKLPFTGCVLGFDLSQVCCHKYDTFRCMHR